MRRRRLTAEEAELWHKVARTVEPLEPSRAVAPAPADEAPPAEPSAADGASSGVRDGDAASARGRPVAETLDRRITRRLRRGRLPIEAEFDLHGHTQASAHDALLHFLSRARSDGRRHVLVVTGRGARGGGILKRSVPRWLEEPAFHRHVVGFHEAGPRHGGAGALYVVLRRTGS